MEYNSDEFQHFDIFLGVKVHTYKCQLIQSSHHLSLFYYLLQCGICIQFNDQLKINHFGCVGFEAFDRRTKKIIAIK